MSDLYREKIAVLAEALNQPELKPQATELLRGLISEVRMVPAPGVPGGHEIELIGDLAGILNLAEADMTKPPRMQGLGSDTMVAGTCSNQKLQTQRSRPEGTAGVRDAVSQFEMVAGACNQRYLRLVERQIPKLAA